MRLHRWTLLFAACFFAAPVHGAGLERGAAIVDPQALSALDSGYSLARMLDTSADATAAALFALPSMTTLREALDREFDRYAAQDTKLKLLDRSILYAPTTRFVLAGVVNRTDRAYKMPASCGEIRLIYRPVVSDGAAKPSRLPMTLNVVLNARNDSDGMSCAEIARRWLAIGDDAAGFSGKGGLLEFVRADHIDRIETNIQIARAVDDPNDFEGRADYLLKVFRYDRVSSQFLEAAMENQIDREKLAADAALAALFKTWLFAPDNFAALDRGTLVVPEKFLTMRAIASIPANTSMDRARPEIFQESEVVEALARISMNGIELDNIKSPAGFARRIDDMTCSGCHQTRAIGGFHFPGTDRTSDGHAAVVTPASPHFFGDQPRRRDIIGAFRDGRTPDFSRGFSARPQARRSMGLEGTTYLDGWGAHCDAPTANAPKRDRSFASWTCIAGLSCQMPNDEKSGALLKRAGLCFPGN